MPGLTGLLRNAVLRVLAWCIAGLAYSIYGYADWIARMGVPFTAADEYLQAWAALIGVYPLPAAPSIGTATFTGNPTSAILDQTALVRQDGTPFVTTSSASFDSTTGTIIVPIQASVSGAFTNDPGGTPISLAAPIAGINSLGVTGSCSGGADPETNDALRTRMLVKYRQPPQGGSCADYINWALEVPGCTRAWVVGGGYGPGTVAVFPMFDDSESAYEGFPQGTDGCASEETRGPTATGDQLLVAEHLWTVQPLPVLVYVASPQPFRVDVVLDGLTPNTEEMQTQIVAALNDMFLAVAEIQGVIWPSDLYEAILATPGIAHFEMSVPADAVQAGPGQLPVLGTFTAPLPSP